jgi:hypothetical protein
MDAEEKWQAVANMDDLSSKSSGPNGFGRLFHSSDRTAPRFMVRDRDGIYGESFRSRIEGMGTEEICVAPRSPWQNCYVERLIGSIRRECLNHVIVMNAWHLRRILKGYFAYYHRSRTHMSLDKDAPESRTVQDVEAGRIIQIQEVGGLHRRYERVAA